MSKYYKPATPKKIKEGNGKFKPSAGQKKGLNSPKSNAGSVKGNKFSQEKEADMQPLDQKLRKISKAMFFRKARTGEGANTAQYNG